MVATVTPAEADPTVFTDSSEERPRGMMEARIRLLDTDAAASSRVYLSPAHARESPGRARAGLQRVRVSLRCVVRYASPPCGIPGLARSEPLLRCKEPRAKLTLNQFRCLPSAKQSPAISFFLFWSCTSSKKCSLIGRTSHFRRLLPTFYRPGFLTTTLESS